MTIPLSREALHRAGAALAGARGRAVMACARGGAGSSAKGGALSGGGRSGGEDDDV